MSDGQTHTFLSRDFFSMLSKAEVLKFSYTKDHLADCIQVVPSLPDENSTVKI